MMQEPMLSQNIIITERCRSLRQLGRNALRGKWGNGILAMVIFIVCMMLPQLIFNNLLGMNMASIFTSDGFTYGMDTEFYQQMYNSIPQTSILSAIWMLLISGAMELGLMIYFLASFRGHDVVPRDVFLGFERFGKALGLMLYRSIFIFLWTLLFIVPGIIASIRYSQAFFVLADDPSKSIRQCMNESKSMMRGNKMKYFLLGLSFIGWAILCSIPGSFLEGIINALGANGAVTAILTGLISALIMAPVYTYVYSTMAGFYEILAGHLIKETAPAPLSADQIEVDAPVEKIEEVIEVVENSEAAKAEEAEAGQIEADALPKAGPSQPELAAPDVQDTEAAPEVQPEDQPLLQPLEEEDQYHD